MILFVESAEESEPAIAVMDVNKLRQLWEAERAATVEENEALRQGLHEILESIRKQDGEFMMLKGLHVSKHYYEQYPKIENAAFLRLVMGRSTILRAVD